MLHVLCIHCTMYFVKREFCQYNFCLQNIIPVMLVKCCLNQDNTWLASKISMSKQYLYTFVQGKLSNSRIFEMKVNLYTLNGSLSLYMHMYMHLKVPTNLLITFQFKHIDYRIKKFSEHIWHTVNIPA